MIPCSTLPRASGVRLHHLLHHIIQRGHDHQVVFAQIGSRPGTYALILRASANRKVMVGKFGILRVCQGFYLYVGSAFGPGGLRARVRHHFNKPESPHWHIDYLRAGVQLKEVWFSYDPFHRECAWAKILRITDGASIPLKGFGASDCGCPSHLFYVESPPGLRDFRRLIREDFLGHHPVSFVKVPGLTT